jgi:MarR family transcriptional regulator, organic hydroperoxide resistance regulator
LLRLARRKPHQSDAVEVARLLRDINRRYRDQPIEEDISRSGLTFPQVSVITTLFERGPLSLKDLSRELGLSHSTVSGIVDRLSARGFVKRAVDADDRRVSSISVTAEVKRYVEEGMPRGQAGRLEPALRSATREQRRAIREGLTLLRSLLEKVGG